MFTFLVVLQVFVAAITLGGTLLVLRLRGSLDNRYIFLSALCIDIYAIGYLQEMLCRDMTSFRVVVAFEYCGLSFAALAFSVFIFRYCHVSVSAWIRRILLVYCLFIFTLVQMGDKTNLYYTSVSFADEGIFPHAIMGKGAIYYSFAAFQTIALLTDAVVVLLFRRKVEAESERRRLLFLFGECAIPIVGLFGTTFFDLGGWDPSPMLLCILITLMNITLREGRFYDAVTLALENMFHNVGNAVIVIDRSKNYLCSNKMADILFPELMEWSVGHRANEFFEELFINDADTYFERDGRFYKSTRTELWEKRHLIGYTITITDTTEMQHQVNEMKKLKDSADVANEAKSTFLANMSHEIRTPLNAIIGMAELAEREKSENLTKEYVGQIKSAGKMLLGIVSDVLDFSKAESGKLELVPIEFDTKEFLNTVINVANMRIGDKPIDFIVDIDPTLPKTLFGDDVHIRQVFMNLLSNAEKFTNGGHIKLTVNGVREGSSLRIKGAVEDTGMGIHEDDKAKLFTAFQQIDVRRNRKLEGSGLGLAIFAQLVTLMNGTYRLESEYGKGSTFSFEIMVGIIDFAQIHEGKRTLFSIPKNSAFNLYSDGTKNKSIEAENENKGYEDIKDYSSKAILVVDDNRVNVKVLSAFLKHFNVTADAAYSGSECIEMIKLKQYDLIFMDHMMPDMDGVETTKRIRKLDCKCPIVACTANVIKGVEKMFMSAGMDDFIPKPIQMDTLKEKMSRFLD